MSYSKVFLKPKKEESLLRFHPWVFSGAIQRIEGKPEEGDLVEVYGANQQFLAVGHYQIGSIAVRVLSFASSQYSQQQYIPIGTRRRRQSARIGNRYVCTYSCHAGTFSRNAQIPAGDCRSIERSIG